MRISTARCIYYISLALAAILMYGGAFCVNYVLIGIGAVVGFAGLFVWIIYGKCPKCKKHLGRTMPEYCPHCGERIE